MPEMLHQLVSVFADSVTQDVWVTDAEGNLRFFNGNWLDSPVASNGSDPLRSPVHPEDAGAAAAAFQEALLTGKEFETEQRRQSPNGEHRCFLRKGKPLRDPKTGEVIFWFGVDIDIPDRGTTRSNNRENHEKFLFDITEKIRIARDPEKLLEEISISLGGYLGLHRCLFNEIDLDSDTETVHRDYARDGDSIAGKHKISAYSPEPSEMMANGQTIVNRNSEIDPRTAKYFGQTYRPAKEIAYITVPMMRGGRWVASLWCSDDKPRDWSNDEIALVENIAERTWAAVERLSTESEIRRSQKTFFELIENAPFGMYIVDSDFRIVSMNAGSQTKAFANVRPVIGRDFAEAVRILWPEPVATDIIATFRHTLETGEPYYSRDFTHLRGDIKTVESYEWVLHRIELPNAELGVVCYFYDSTELRDAERREREQVRKALMATAKFESVFNQSAQFAVILDPDGGLVEANDLAVEQSGFAREELAGRPFWETGWWSGSAKIQEQLREGVEVARFGETWRSVLRNELSDGKDRSFEIALHPIRDESGQVIFIHATGLDVTEQRAVQEELRSVANAAPALVWVSNEAGELTYFNDRWYQYTGLTPEESLGSGWISAVAEEDLAVMLPRWDRCRNAGEPYEGECRYRRSDGEYRWHAFRALPRHDKNGKITTWYGISIDIHKVKIATDRVKTSEERYRALTELSPQMVCMSTPEGAITYVNTYTREWTGKTHEELLGEGWASLIHPDHRERILAVWKTAVAVASEYEVDIPLLHVDGTYRTLYTRALPIMNESGEVLSWIGTALDVEDRKRAEENLRESEERFRQVSDSAPVLIWMSNEEKDRIWFNKAWLDFTGRSIDEELGRGWFDELHPDDHDRFVNIFSNAFQNRQEFTIEYRLRGSDGGYRWFLDRGVPRLTPDGSFLGYIGSCVDIHDRKTAESALRQSEARLQLATRIGNYGTWDLNFIEERQVWSDKLFDIFGLSPTPDRSVGREYYECCVAPEDLDRLYKAHEGSAANHGQYSIEYRIRRADTGEIRWLDVAAQNFYDSEGRPVRCVGITQDITERKLAEEAVRASEERLKLAQQAGNVGVWDWDVVNGSVFWSDQMWSFYGEEPRKFDFTDGLWKERIYPDDRGRMRRAVRSALASSDTEFKEEFRIVRKDGEVRWLEVIATIDRDSDGSPLRVYGVNLDITDSKAIAERIRSSEAQLRLVTNSIPALVSYIDRDERYRFVNQRYSEWFGRKDDEFTGRSMAEILGASAREALKAHIDEVLSGETVTFESWIDYAAAGRRYVHVSYVPDFSVAGEVLGFYALVTDLTSQKLSEERLRSTEDRMRTVSESFTDYAIISMDSEGLIDSWNPGAENIFGFTADEIIGEPSKILFTREDVERGIHEQELLRARELGRASDERWHVRKDGSRFFASGVTAPLYIGDELAGYAKIATDLTEKKRGAEALQRAYDEMESRVLERTRELASMNETLMREISERQTAERQKIDLLKRLVSGQEVERRRIARDLHDHLGQRLTALRLKLASLREATAGNEDLYDRATRLQQIAELIDSEVSFLAWELRPSTLDELGLIDAMSAFVKEWSKHYEINAEFHSAGLGDARLDREAETHLYRITQEALNNIYKHANAKSVSVLVERTGSQVVLIVEDDGSGFTQAEAQRHKKSNRGLGLAGMRERADLIGGSLEIESEVGKGTTIYVRIPLESDQRNKQ